MQRRRHHSERNARGMDREDEGTHQVLELSARLLDDAVLAAEDDAHAREVADLGAAHDERVDVEPTAG